MMSTNKSTQAFLEAQQVFPGGVNSPVRAFRAVNRDPVFIESAKGAYLYDVDGNQYIDYVLSWGPMILGHAQEQVLAAVTEAAAKGTSFGAPSPLETQLARLIQARIPSMERLRMVSSGTEATMSAIRVARGVTGREKILKFKGCYHGHSDSFLVNAGSGVATFELEDSPGVPQALSSLTLSTEFNNSEELQMVFDRHKDELAAVIIEPIAGNMGLIPANRHFLQEIRRLTLEQGTLLIFDEVMTGFRCDYSSAQERYGITPDLTTLGKVVGGGLPAAVFGGKKEYMDQVAPAGAIYQAGTLSGNPLAMAAGIATLQQLTIADYDDMHQLAVQLTAGIQQAAEAAGIPVQTTCQGTMWGFFFHREPVTNFQQAKESNQVLFSAFYQKMLAKGIYLAPSQYESNFLSTAHSSEDIDTTIAAFQESLQVLKSEGFAYA